jgi:RHS repeat-associated protein
MAIRSGDVESELMYYGGRYYDPELSRFVIPDPFVPDLSIRSHSTDTQ